MKLFKGEKKQTKILIFLLLVLFLLVFYLILTSDQVKKMDNSGQQIKQDNSVLLEADYKAKVKEFFNTYENLISRNDFTRENITELKNKLLGLKGVPKKFQGLHVRFVLALNKMENYLNQRDELEKGDSLREINQLKADYGWLND